MGLVGTNETFAPYQLEKRFALSAGRLDWHKGDTSPSLSAKACSQAGSAQAICAIKSKKVNSTGLIGLAKIRHCTNWMLRQAQYRPIAPIRFCISTSDFCVFPVNSHLTFHKIFLILQKRSSNC